MFLVFCCGPCLLRPLRWDNQGRAAAMGLPTKSMVLEGTNDQNHDLQRNSPERTYRENETLLTNRKGCVSLATDTLPQSLGSLSPPKSLEESSGPELISVDPCHCLIDKCVVNLVQV